MKTLYINTCLGDVIIKLFKNNKVLNEETIIGQTHTSQFIMPTIKKVLDKEKIDAIIVVNGPGSFTGVRLGVTIAKTFAYILNIPIYTITSLEEKAYSVNLKKEVIAVPETNGYYIGIFDKKNKLIGDYQYLSKEQYTEFTLKYDVITDVTLDYKKIIKFALRKSPVNPHAVKPLYIKLIEVEK